MAAAPQFTQQQVGPTAGWDAQANANAHDVRRWLDGQPLCVKRFYRVSASNPSGTGDNPAYRNLVSYAAGQYEGGLVYLRDPEGSESPLVYSDGLAWRYVATDNAVTGIS